MRPPKRILLIDADPNRQGVTRFLLWVYGRVVISARNIAEADRLAENIDLVVAYDIVDDMRLSELRELNNAVRRTNISPSNGCNSRHPIGIQNVLGK